MITHSITSNLTILFKDENGFTNEYPYDIYTGIPFTSEEDAEAYAVKELESGTTIYFNAETLEEMKERMKREATQDIQSIIFASYPQDKQNADNKTTSTWSTFLTANNVYPKEELDNKILTSVNNILGGDINLSDELLKYSNEDFAFGDGQVSVRYAVEKLIKAEARSIWSKKIVIEHSQKIALKEAEIEAIDNFDDLRRIVEIEWSEFPTF